MSRRYGTVCETGSLRLRIKWERREGWIDGELNSTRPDTKRTWIACDRLRIVPTDITPAVGPGGWCLDTSA